MFSPPPGPSAHPPRTAINDTLPHGLGGKGPPNGPMPVPPQPSGAGQFNTNSYRQRADSRPEASPFARNNDPSGPGNKSESPRTTGLDTKHVPCKFFRQGTCTAGDACPYSHSREPLEPCKFFLNGNCKYGKRCALPHIVDGQIVNPQSLTTRPVRTQIGGAAAAPSFPNVGTSPVIPPGGAVAQMDQISYANPSHLTNNQMVSLDVPPSRFGTSPRDHGLSWSPPGPGVSALDAPLPSSFNSQEPPNIAKYGPSGASVPSRFGWDHPLGSPPSSAKAFGNLDSLALGSARASSFATQKELGSSPPTSAAAEVEPRRIMHSQQRSRPSNISSSLPVQGPLDDAYSTSAIREDDPHEEDLVPSTLDDLLTPEERFRRLSRSGDEHGLSPRPSYSSFGSPPDSKVGSPSHNSPSRFGSFFASQQAKRENQEAQAQLHGHGSGPAFGHVGSPLRNSHMNGEGKNGARFGNDPGPSPPLGPISPPAKAGHAGHNYVSSLSEQLKSVSIGRAPGTKDADGAGGTRNVSNSSASTTSAVSTGAPKYGDRAVSNSSVGRERIDEEPLFSMDDEHEPRHIKERERAKAEAATSPRRFADVVSGETPTNGSVKG